MGYRTFQIILDSPTQSFHGNSNITGRVVLELDKPKKVRGVKIKFEGRAKVKWHKSEDDETETYSAREEYFSEVHYLVGSDSSEIEIPAGEYAYPFSTTLPSKLPTSFDGKYGNIRYYIRAVLDRPWKFDEEVKILLTVVPVPVDLNMLPQVKEPVILETSKTFCCLFCESGPLTLTGTIPYSGFVAGQTFVANVEVDNASNIEIASVKCKIVKEMKWIAKKPSTKKKYEKDSLVKVYLDGVGPHESKSWNQNIEIPLTPVLNLDGCSIIFVEYYFLIEADPSGPHSCLELKFPITFGTVPLYQMGGTAPFPGAVPNWFAAQPSAPNHETIENPPPSVGFMPSHSYPIPR